MPNKKREKLMKAATERKMRRRSSFFEQLFRPGHKDGLFGPRKNKNGDLNPQSG